MPTMTVLYEGELTKDRWFPPIMEAARVLPKAKQLRCDRIRIERLSGARVTEFTLPQVEAWVREQRITLQPDAAARMGRELELRKPMIWVPDWRKAD